MIFDPATIADDLHGGAPGDAGRGHTTGAGNAADAVHATFEDPHRLATGVRDVFVNGVQVLSGEEPTGASPGRVVRGPGWVR